MRERQTRDTSVCSISSRRFWREQQQQEDEGKAHLYFWVKGHHRWKRHTFWNIVD
jgi:hypothetical protein